MRCVVLRFTAFAMLLHLSQVPPGLSCTFTQLNGTQVPTITAASMTSYNSSFGIEGCFKKCYEMQGCMSFVFHRADSVCNIFSPAEGMIPVISPDEYRQQEIYQLDRNVFNVSCPTVKQWTAQ